MKIRNLVIHNIASIEDAAIDFDKPPLSDTDLFLITGTTGAGKTTLLDAICLALYNTTPRISKGKKQDLQTNRDNLTECDPRNIMRQNTGYAFSRLVFDGNDGKSYCAEWSVERGTKQKPTSNLSNAVWSIRNITDNVTTSGSVTQSYKEVAEIIRSAVGLDFNQFCRTTMLAQGEFTEFLKSDEKAKAEILEKISGSDIYRKIGAEIYNQYLEAKRRLEEEERKHAEIVVLSPEERQCRQEELESIDKLLSECQDTSDRLQILINWLGNDILLRQKLTEAQETQKAAEEAVLEDAFVSKENDVNQWNSTIEVRENRRNAIFQKGRADNASQELDRLEMTFREALSGEQYVLDWYDALLLECKGLEDQIFSQEANASVYSEEQTIIADIRNLMDVRDNHLMKTALKRKYTDEDLPKALDSYRKSTEKLVMAVKALENAGKELDMVSECLAELNLKALREEKDFLKDIMALKEEFERHEAQIAASKESINEKNESLEELKTLYQKENSELKRLMAEHDRRRQTVDNFAKVIRAQLNESLGNEDNICPVCGQHVTSLKSDAVLDQEYQKIKDEYEAQNKKASDAYNAVISLSNKIALEAADLNRSYENLKSSLDSLELMLESREDADILRAASSKDIRDLIDKLAVRIAEGEKVERKKDELQIVYNNMLSAKGEAEISNMADNGAVQTLKNALSALENDILGIDDTVNKLTAKIDSSLADTLPWDSDWNLCPEDFIDELKAKASGYRTCIESRDKTRGKIDAAGPVLENIRILKNEIIRTMPDWKTDGIRPEQRKNLNAIWIALNADLKIQVQIVEDARKEYIRNNNLVDIFLGNNPEYTIVRIDELDKISTDQHNQEAEYVRNRHAAALTAAAHYKIVLQEKSNHEIQRPDFLKEDDTLESLAAAKNGNDALRDELNTRKGILMSELKNDDEAIMRKGDTTLLDRLGTEFEKWRSFNSCYGDKEGSTLSRIAQSFVLGSLLNSANHHLRNMAPRYRLLVNPGSLNLKLEDRYNGFSTRSANSISGGESFLVSLALALALADFGQHLGVSTLFIDEGFGTLSGDALQIAVNTLKMLHGEAGRQVGIISHREEVKENIPVQIQVTLVPGTSASRVETIG